MAEADGSGIVIGVDGGGTWTRLALADDRGREHRRRGPATLVDPAAPAEAVHRLVALVRDLAAEADLELPARALYAGLAGTGDPGVRQVVRKGLADAGIAARVEVVTDGELALDAALADSPGIVLVAGTGSVAYGRSEDGRLARCGGWGLVLGDEGSGYAMARDGLHALLRAADGRGEPTELLPRLLSELGLEWPEQIPAWAGRSDKAEIAGLAPVVVELAEAGDAVARRIVEGAARDLVRHVDALLRRLGPWTRPPPVVFFGSVLDQPGLARRVTAGLDRLAWPTVRAEAHQDPVSAALRQARAAT